MLFYRRNNMFTGIVQACVPVSFVETKPGLVSFSIELPNCEGLQDGASIAVDGVCLTVVDISGNVVRFDAMEETLNKSTIGMLSVGSRANIERSAKVGDEIGGHLVSGHVTGTAKIIAIDNPENNHVVTFHVAAEIMSYIFEKGFVALDGCSLTIVDADKTTNTFTVWLIPETLDVTTFGFKKVGDSVNIEIDSRTQIIVDTVNNYLSSQK